MELNVEQRRLVQSKPNGNMLIRGAAGSGKTTVAVNRIPYLLNHYCFAKDDKLLMVTFNKTLIKYIKYVYDKVEEENRLDYESLFGSNKNKLELKTIDGLIYKYYKKYKEKNNLKLEIMNDPTQRLDIISNCIAKLKKVYPDVKILDQKNCRFLIDEIEWIKSCNYLDFSVYKDVDRIGRMSKQKSDAPQKLAKNSRVREAIFKLMELYDKEMRKNNVIDFKDMGLLALKYVKNNKVNKYTHIIIDESQDLTRVQLEVLAHLYAGKSYSSITFVADTAQSIYSHAWLVRGRSFSSIGFDMTGKSNSLAKNYRTTTQIAQAAYSLIENDENIVDDDNFVKPSLIDKQGKYPSYKFFKDDLQELQYIANEIKENLSKKYDYRDIAVVARTKIQLDNISKYFLKNDIPHTVFKSKDVIEFESNKVKLLTLHSIKGLEFKVVMIVGVNKNVLPINNQGVVDAQFHKTMERKLLYVGMTRATELLYISSSRRKSEFIDDIDYRYLILKPNCKFRKFHDVNIDEYIFKDNIIDLYSNEEKVRQWMLKELMEVYKYPKQLIDIEYTVNNFSNIGKVDICVSIYSNKRRVPYIFIELKRRGKNIQNGIEQLKSYMSCSKNCQYGIVTDGNDIIILDNEFEVIDDIPEFNVLMLPSSIETFEYNDLIHNRTLEFVRDFENIKDIIVETDPKDNENIEDKEYTSESLRKFTIFNNIAAGKPIFINSEIQGEFYLPKEWFNPMNEYFILKVKGDSMIDAGIDDEDLVVIERQDSVNNRDIAAVDVDGNATLKRVMPMGDTVLLISENNAYEPMQVQSNSVKIIGKAVGVIKNKS